MNKEIKNINDKHQYHGYNQFIDYNGIWCRCNYKNGIEIGYEEINDLPYGSIGDIGTTINYHII